jgi:glycosyltransferase involved in cell wall biosynthesis
VYILITPAKNEQESLPLIADSVIKQSIVPKVWIIVDDGSADETPAIIRELMAKHYWIQSVRLPPHPRDITFHYSYVCKRGFDHAINYCNEKQIPFDFIALLDADTCLTETYFEHLISAFGHDPKLGIASGGIYYNVNGKLQWDKVFENDPAGTGRMWRNECFFETGGYMVEPAPDSLSNVKAELYGWKTKNFKEIIAVQTRPTSSAEGVWKGYFIKGNLAHYVNLHPILVLLNVIDFSRQKPHYRGIAFAYGYLKGVLRRDKKIEDEWIKDYYRNKRIRRYLPDFLFFK